jgi:hypothetical protein
MGVSFVFFVVVFDVLQWRMERASRRQTQGTWWLQRRDPAAGVEAGAAPYGLGNMNS